MEPVSEDIQKAREALKNRFAVSGRVGKGMGRRTKKVVHKKNGSDDAKLRVNLNKVGCRQIGGIQEVNFFPTEGDLYHFEKCDCWISPETNTTAVFGTPERAPITKYLPGIFNQLGLAGLMNNQNLFKGAEEKKAEAQEEEDVPELVESFEEVSKEE